MAPATDRVSTVSQQNFVYWLLVKSISVQALKTICCCVNAVTPQVWSLPRISMTRILLKNKGPLWLLLQASRVIKQQYLFLVYRPSVSRISLVLVSMKETILVSQNSLFSA